MPTAQSQPWGGYGSEASHPSVLSAECSDNATVLDSEGTGRLGAGGKRVLVVFGGIAALIFLVVGLAGFSDGEPRDRGAVELSAAQLEQSRRAQILSSLISTGTGDVALMTDEEKDKADERRFLQEDEIACGAFRGFVRAECLKKRADDRKSPRIWSDNEVRRGLWQTEKALADLEVRQYKHGKERAALHKAHEDKMSKFKGRMETVLQLIHQIQDEMGLRHSEMVNRLMADVNATRDKLQAYLDDGMMQVHGKLDVLTDRERALTQRLLEMIEAQATALHNKIVALHQVESNKIAAVHAYTEGVEEAQKAGDARIQRMIDEVRAKLTALDLREDGHNTQLSNGIAQQDQKRVADMEAVSQHEIEVLNDVRANLTNQLVLDKADIRARIEAGFKAANLTREQLDQEAERLADLIETRLREQAAYQARNDTWQDNLIAALKVDLEAFNQTAILELQGIETNLTVLEDTIASTVNELQIAQKGRRAAILAHVNSAVAAADAVQNKLSDDVMLAFESLVGPAAALAVQLNAVVSQVEAQRTQDLQALDNSLQAGLESTKTTALHRQTSNYDKLGALLTSRSSALDGRIGSVSEQLAYTNAALKAIMNTYAEGQEANNQAQQTVLNSLRHNQSVDTTANTIAFQAIDQRIKQSLQQMQAARAELLSTHSNDISAAKLRLEEVLETLKSNVLQTLQLQTLAASGSLQGGLRTTNRTLNSLSRRINRDLGELKANMASERKHHDDMALKTDAAIQAVSDMTGSHDADWKSRLSRLGGGVSALNQNISTSAALWDRERLANKQSLLKELQDSLSTLQAAVLVELGNIGDEIHSALDASEAHARSEEADLSRFETSHLNNATVRLSGAENKQEGINALQREKQSDQEKAEENMAKQLLASIQTVRNNMNTAQQRLHDTRDRIHNLIHAHDTDIKAGFNSRLALVTELLEEAVHGSNETEMEDFRQGCRAVLREVETFAWQMGARGAALKKAVEASREKSNNAFLKSDNTLRAIRAEQTKTTDSNERQASGLESRLNAIERQLQLDQLSLHDNLVYTDSSIKNEAPDKLADSAEAFDGKLQQSSSGLFQALRQAVQEAAAETAKQEHANKLALSAILKDLADAQAVVNQHVQQQTSLFDSANQSVSDDHGRALREIQKLHPMLQRLEDRLASVYGALREEHEATMSVNKELIKTGLANLQGKLGISVEMEDDAVDSLLKAAIAGPDEMVRTLESELSTTDNRFRGAMADAQVGHTKMHADVRKHLAKLKKIMEVSNANLTASFRQLNREVGAWSSTTLKEYRKETASSNKDTSDFRTELEGKRQEIINLINRIRNEVQGNIGKLQREVSKARNTLLNAQRTLRHQHRTDFHVIKNSIRTGVAELQRSALISLRKQQNNATKSIQGSLTRNGAIFNVLSQSINKMIRTMTRDVRKAEKKELSDNNQQGSRLRHLSRMLQNWWNGGQSRLQTLERRIGQLHGALQRRTQRLQRDQARSIQRVASVLQSSINQLNTTITKRGSDTSARLIRVVGSKLAVLDNRLGHVRRQIQNALQKRSTNLENFNKNKGRNVEKIRLRIQRLYQRLENAGIFSKRRTTNLERVAERADKRISRRVENHASNRGKQRERIKRNTLRRFRNAKNNFARRLRNRKRHMRNRVKNVVHHVSRRVVNQVRHLRNQVKNLRNQLKGLENREKHRHQRLRNKIKRETDRRSVVMRLEQRVADEFKDIKSAVRNFKTNETNAHIDTTDLAALTQRHLARNDGLDTRIRAILRTLNTLQRNVADLRREQSRHRGRLNRDSQGVRRDSRWTKNQITAQLNRLETQIGNELDRRRQNHARASAKIDAIDTRVANARSAFDDIKLQWGATDLPASVVKEQPNAADLLPGFVTKFYYFRRNLGRVPGNLKRVSANERGVSQTIEFRNHEAFKSVAPNVPPSRIVVVWTGYIKITEPGEYTFSTASDDGSHLWIDFEKVVRNGGLHGVRKKSAVTSLGAGYHRFKADFFENHGGEAMIVKYSGPDTNGQEVPLTGFHDREKPVTKGTEGVADGFSASFYYMRQNLNRMPALGARAPDARAVCPSIEYPNHDALETVAPGIPGSRIAVIWTGFIKIEQPGEYFFNTASDDGSHLWINDKIVVNNGGLHGVVVRQGSMSLATGYYKFKADFFENHGGEAMTVKYKGPDTNNAWVPLKGFHGRKPALPEPSAKAPGFSAKLFFINNNINRMPWVGGKVPDARGVSETIEYTNHNALKALAPSVPPSRIAVVWTGYILISTAGEYTFATKSDDGSHLWVDAEMVVNNGGLHGPREKKGKMSLAAGYHRIKADFFENQGGEYMTVHYSGPDTNGQMVPMKGFHGQAPAMSQPAGIVHGFDAKFYYIRRTLNRMPAVSGRLPNFRAVTDTIEFPNHGSLNRVAPGIPGSRIAVVWKGYIKIEQAGEYAFSTASDDGSHLWIGKELIVDNGGLHGTRERRGEINLESGFYQFKADFFENYGGESMTVKYKGPDTDGSWRPLKGFH